MASVFLSYDREDLARARALALALEKAGHSVWWDRHIKGGAQYSKEIETALAAADAIVVLWSRQSVESGWVRDEAAIARDTNRMVPASIDGVLAPLGFRQYQTVDLSGWKGRTASPAFREILGSIGSLDRHPAAAATPRKQRSALSRSRVAAAAAVIMFALAVAALLIWRPWSRRSATPVVAIIPAAQSTSARAFADDLFVGLGAAQAGRIGPVELVREEGRTKADLILEVATRPSAASLVLLRAEDRRLLFSQEVEARSRAVNLKLSVQAAAAAALECAATALKSPARLPLETLKDFLRACTSFHSLYGSEEAYIPISQLEQIIRREPRFIPARKLLLLAGTFMRSIPTENAQPSEQWLKQLVEKSKRIDPRMPELGLAELELLPTTDFAGRFRLIDELAAEYPNDLFVLGAQAELLMRVGRNTEAVETAERAVRLHPLSPYTRSEYVRTLAFSGRSERAVEELKAMDVLDEVAMNLTESKFRFNLAYGDPRSALALFRKYGTNNRNEAILLAKIEPTQANRQRALEIARSDVARTGFYAPFAEVLVEFGREAEAYDTLMRLPLDRVDQFLLQTIFRPTLKALRQNARFLRIAKRFGLLDYWRQSGRWPDFCSEPDLPYDCKTEAAKLAA